ncbi:HdeD family acid-resistance protein [Curtobacterium sp. 22159]|uniref:HdeD family acid-resistance protein n=1 Tax=Curtobacterium sp. 22159 TaxID=3453882 RepID=UPI003F85872E
MDVARSTDDQPPVDRRLRTAFGVLGVVALLAGVAALVLPHATLVAVVWVFGIYLVVAGATLLVRAFTGGTGAWRRIGLVVLGVLVLAGGVFAILHPPVGVRWLGLTIGFAWLLEGITLLYAPTTDHRVLAVTGAVLSMLSGLLLINLPYLGAVFAVAAVSSVLIVSGIVQLVIAVRWPRVDGSGDAVRPDVPAV